VFLINKAYILMAPSFQHADKHLLLTIFFKYLILDANVN